MKTASKISAGLAVLVLALISIWAAVNPVIAYAASATAQCSDGSSRTCTGVSCQSQDSSGSSNGYCFCTREDGSNDVKFCPRIGRPGIEE